MNCESPLHVLGLNVLNSRSRSVTGCVALAGSSTITITAASAPPASRRASTGRELRERGGGGSGPGAGAPGGLGGLTVATSCSSARAPGCGAVGNRRRGRAAAHDRAGDFTEPRDQLDPLVGADRRAKRGRGRTGGGRWLGKADSDAVTPRRGQE